MKANTVPPTTAPVQNPKSRVVWLVVCMGLIGGIGCVTQSSLTPAQQMALQQEAQALEQKTAQGDLLATTRLAIRYLDGSRGVSRDVSKGLRLLNQAADRQYAPAEFALGIVYADGPFLYLDGSHTYLQAPQEPVRGMELFKRSATHACTIAPLLPWSSTAITISTKYRSGSSATVDLQQADLWLARSILHCRYPSAQYVVGMNLNPKATVPPSKADTMGFLLLMPPSNAASKLQSTLSPQEMQTAMRKAEALRQAVAESEKQYPAPPAPPAPPPPPGKP